MGLCWNLNNIKNNNTTCFTTEFDDGVQTRRMHTDTNTIIWLMYCARVDEITDKNWKDFATKFLILNPYRKYMGFRSEKHYQNYAVRTIKRHIGLKVWVDNFNHKLKGKWSDAIVRVLENEMRHIVDMAHLKQESQRKRKNARNAAYRQRKKEARQ